MVTLSKLGNSQNREWLELYGLSTDTKPVGTFNGVAISNASTYLEMDTSKVFMYDEENSVWREL